MLPVVLVPVKRMKSKVEHMRNNKPRLMYGCPCTSLLQELIWQAEPLLQVAGGTCKRECSTVFKQTEHRLRAALSLMVVLAAQMQQPPMPTKRLIISPHRPKESCALLRLGARQSHLIYSAHSFSRTVRITDSGAECRVDIRFTLGMGRSLSSPGRPSMKVGMSTDKSGPKSLGKGRYFFPSLFFCFQVLYSPRLASS